MQVPDEKHRLAFPSLNGLSAWITVGDKPLDLHGVEESGGKLVAYVEATEGKSFKVHFADMRGSFPSPKDHVVRLFVDGARVNGVFVKSGAFKFSQPANFEDRFVTFQGREETSTTILPFLFSQLTTTDDDDNACTDENVIKGLGSVQLKYWTVHNVRPAKSFTGATRQAGPIHERSKKAALSHQAGFGAPITVTPNARWTFDFLDANSPPPTVEFRYRSRAILQFEDLIPASPNPSSSPQPPVSPEPQPVVAAPPAVAGPSNPRCSPSLTVSGSNSRSPSATDDASRITKLEAELEALRRRERMAELERELEELRSGGAVASGSGSSSLQATGGEASGKKRVKPEPGETDVEVLKRVKKEEGEKIEQEKRENKKKGKPLEVIDLCDSD